MASVCERPEVAEWERPSQGRRVHLRPWHVALALTFAIGAFTLLFRLGEFRSLGSHEGYAIVPAREMLLAGDYVVPRFGGLPRLQKPPLIYWTILASAKLSGRLDVAAARLPAALAGLLLAGLIARWAFRRYGGIAAVGAAAAQLTSVYVVMFARKAEVDMILVLLIAAALSLVAGQDPAEWRPSAFLRWVAIWACAAVSWLGKFHFGPAMIFAPAVAWLVLERRWRSLLGLLNPVGLLLFAAAAGVWPALVLQQLPDAWSVWQEETIGRAVGELGRQPVWFYLPHLVIWTLPWTVFALPAWPASWRAAFAPLAGGLRQPRVASGAAKAPFFRGINDSWRTLIARGDPHERLLWVWLAVSFALVTASANKHPDYILPALPVFSLWTGRRFAQLERQAREGRRLLPWPLAVSLTLAAAAAVFGPAFLRERLPEEIPVGMLTLVSGAAGLGLAAAGWLLVVRRNIAAGGVVAATWVVAYGAATVWLILALDHRAGAYQFAEDVRENLGSDAEIGVYGMDQDAVVWYLGEPVYRAETAEQIAARLAAGRPLRLVTLARREPVLARLGDLRVIERFTDRPGCPKVTLGHYRKMALVELSPSADQVAALPAASGPR